MSRKRKMHTEETKARVALEAIKGVKTLSELSAVHEVHPTVITQWKRQLVQGAAEVFRRSNSARSEEEVTKPLYEEIGRLKVEIDWLKKKL
jgi:putative transposase